MLGLALLMLQRAKPYYAAGLFPQSESEAMGVTLEILKIEAQVRETVVPP